MQIAPSTYFAAKRRPPSARAESDATLKPELERIHREHFGVYGVEKLWRQLRREGVAVGRDRVARLMGELGLRGVVRGTGKRTTVPAPATARPADLVKRNFTATAPNRTWVADLTYVWTWAGFCYVAFIVDVFSRRIVGWRVSTSLSATVVLDALEMAIWTRRADDLTGLVHHSDRGVQRRFKGSMQHLVTEVSIWDVHQAGERFAPDDRSCARPVDRTRRGASIGSEATRVWALGAESHSADALEHRARH